MGVEDARERYDAARPGSAAAARAAGQLGRQLAFRYFSGGAVADRDAAIDLLDESLAVPCDDPTVTHAALGMLLVLRAMPIPLGGDPDGSAALALGAAMMNGSLNTPDRIADRTRADAHLRWIAAHEPPEAPVRKHAAAMAAALRVAAASNPLELMAALGEMATAAAGLGEGRRALAELLRVYATGADPVDEHAALAQVMRQLPKGHRLRPMVMAEIGSLIAGRGHLADLPDALVGLPAVLHDALEDLRDDDPLRDRTIRHLTALLISAAAYAGERDGAERAVRLTETLVAESTGSTPDVAGKDRFLRAMALTSRARLRDDPAEDVRRAVEDLVAALASVPPDDDLRPAVAGMLGALLNDRHLAAGVRANALAGREFLRQAHEALDRAGGDRTVVELAGLMTRALLAVRDGDQAETGRIIEGLEAALARLDAGYPWRSRLDATLGLLYLDRRGPHDLERGLALLRDSGEELAVEMSGRPGLRAVGALATLLDGMLHGDTGAIEAAAARLRDHADDVPLPVADRAALTAIRAYAALAAGDLDGAVTGFRAAAGRLPPAHPLTAHVYTQLAEAYHRVGAVDEAAASGLAALRAYGDDVLLQSGTHDGLAAARTAAAVARQVADRCVDAGYLDLAAEAVEAGRGLVLHAATVAATVPGLLRTTGYADLAAEWEERPDGPVLVDSPLAAVREAAGRLVTVPSDLRPRVLAALGAGRLSGGVGVGDIAAAVRAADADAVVYPLPGDDVRPGRLLLVPADGPARCLAAPALRLDVFVTDDVHLATAATGVRDLPAAGRAGPDLYDQAWPALIDPLVAALGGGSHRLVLVPGDGLGRVPWHAARSPSGRYACETFTFSYAASARQLGAAARRERGTSAPGVLVADPTGDLAWAAAEVAALEAGPYPRAAVLDGRSATPEAVLAAVADPAGWSLLHFSCHACSAAVPADSHLVLAGRARLTVDRILAAARTRPPGTPGGLVVLSACATDLTGTAYDEALTLATAFLAAGAVSVVGTRWRVEDRTTACLMVMFHRYRTMAGLTDPEALRAAQLWMLDPGRAVPPELAELIPDDPKALPDPTAWAAFTHHGT